VEPATNSDTQAAKMALNGDYGAEDRQQQQQQPDDEQQQE